MSFRSPRKINQSDLYQQTVIGYENRLVANCIVHQCKSLNGKHSVTTRAYRYRVYPSTTYSA